MRAFNEAEITRLKVPMLATMGDTSGLGATAVVSKVTAGDDPDARTVVIDELACSSVMDVTTQDMERAKMTDIARPYKVKTEYNALLKRRLKLTVSNVEYRIVSVAPWPANDPVYTYLYLEREG